MRGTTFYSTMLALSREKNYRGGVGLWCMYVKKEKKKNSRVYEFQANASSSPCERTFLHSLCIGQHAFSNAPVLTYLKFIFTHAKHEGKPSAIYIYKIHLHQGVHFLLPSSLTPRLYIHYWQWERKIVHQTCDLIKLFSQL